MYPNFPARQGLYNPANEHDACGVSFIADLHGRKSHRIIELAYTALCNLDHRGAKGAEVNTGDGAGLLVQVPDKLFRETVDFELPAAGSYATGMAFIPGDDAEVGAARSAIEDIVRGVGLTMLGWRHVETNAESLGSMALAVMPSFWQVFFSDPAGSTDVALDRKAFVVRKRIEHEMPGADPDADGPAQGIYFPSLSCRTFVYKGMLTTPQLVEFFPEIRDERAESALAMVHSRFSTNTFPSWPLAHPYRMVAHNGEINTIMGNRNWMRAREESVATDSFGAELDRLYPICTPGASDTATFDEALEFLHLGGYDLPHAVLMMIPEAWERHEQMSLEKKAFYRFNSSMMEPWDGPSSIGFTDGTVIGAVLDRNGLRPSRYWVTADGLVVMGSEAGIIDAEPSEIIEKGRLEPGRMFLVDTAQGRMIPDDEIKATLAAGQPYASWLEQSSVALDDLPAAAGAIVDEGTLVARQQAFGYTHEDLKILLDPMAATGQEAIGSMGTDTPVAVLSDRSRMLFDYFAQLFAQVTNPPLDGVREELVTSSQVRVGPQHNPFDAGPDSCRQIELATPIITSDELERIRHADDDGSVPQFASVTLSGLYEVAGGGAALEAALDRVRGEAVDAIDGGAKILILSDRGADGRYAAIPSLLLTSAVHHHLIRARKRFQTGLVVEAGDAREIHHLCLLIGFGARAVCPYLALETSADLTSPTLSRHEAEANYVKASTKGILKVMSKMGISTVGSYTGAQVFETLGLAQDLLDEYFTGEISRLGGIGLEEIAEETARRHRLAHPDNPAEWAHRSLEVGGEYQWRREGEYHLFNPETVFKLQHATREGRYDVFKQYTSLVDDQSTRLATLRGLFTFSSGDRTPISIDEVEPASEIMKRFSTGAMSYGSISAEAHETLAIAMNRIGAKSNTGEGGEDPERFVTLENGDSKRSSIKQVASGRFGVTSEYLTNSDDLQIKMAQGAKPGEGGQLPGHKVWPWIAKTRHSTPGVGLISPPPHHDIYSIEDLAQLIHDLKNANPAARVHVKLVSQVGVGTVAAGVSKAHADVVLISGHDGGTGASPLTSLKHAGGPWELGLAETQQTLLLNKLRDRIVVQVDGQLKTGRDVVIAALLGGEEFGFATAPLVVSGCVMMRVCHLDTCPVGVATQNPELRERYTGKPEFVTNFFEYIAEEVREILAELGFRTIEEAIGQTDALDVTDAIEHWKADGLDLGPILYTPPLEEGESRFRTTEQNHGLDAALDNELIRQAAPALERGEAVVIESAIRNVNRTVGTMLGHEVTKRYGGAGLPADTIAISLTGSAGNSFGAFVPAGITLRVIGDANDYLGKGLSGGRVIVRPSPESAFVAEDQIISGNVNLYGATSGQAFLRGRAGERFCVRNSGAEAVVEGIGDHGCEYMTGGRVIVLGATGRNFGAGMSGGIAYVWDPDEAFADRLNTGLVAIDPLEDDDRDYLRSMVELHLAETESTVAERLLAGWETSLGQFRKVMPRDYKRVLNAISEATARGDDVDLAVMAGSQG